MDKASDFESEDCGFDPHHGRLFLIHSSLEHIVTAQLRRMVSHGPLESMVRTVFDCISETFGNIYCIFTMTG